MELFLPELFINVLNMSITASYVIIFVIIVRLFLKKSPKIFSYVLWAVVLFRLVCPFSFTSAFSFLKALAPGSGKLEYIPSNIGMLGQHRIDTGISGADHIVNNSLPATVSYASANPMQNIILLLSVAWIIGFLILMIYSGLSYWSLKRQVDTAVLLKDNIYECEYIPTPFVLGIINPKIYLPLGIAEIEKGYILKHEQTHIKRYDYIIKPCAFLALVVHWFNPLVWLSFVLMSRDMEMSCDEQVIKELGTGIKKEYSTSLLSLAVDRKMISPSPLAFGETGTKGRIKNVLNYKRPAFWVIIVTVIAIAAIGVGLMSDPDTTAYKDKMHMAETWAEALKARDGKLRYEIMSESMKERFVTEQKQHQGEDWNYCIGGSSPWVVTYKIEIDGDTAAIFYHQVDSGGETYDRTEYIAFGQENNRLVVTEAKGKIAEWDRVSYFASDAKNAVEHYRKALLESDYLALLSLTHDAPFDPNGQEIWDSIKINSVKIIGEDVRENKACYELELDIQDGGNSAFEKGVFPRWLWLVRDNLGWYVEGLMTGGTPDENWWAAKSKKSKQASEINIRDLSEKSIITAGRYYKTQYPLLAELPQENIYLYGLEPHGTGVVLKYGDKIQTFDWIPTTPRFILPVIDKYDLDHDGKDEIMCVLNVNSGTGIAVYELHVLKLDQSDTYVDYVFRDYIAQLKSMLSYTYNKRDHSITFKTKHDSFTKFMPAEYKEHTVKNITYGESIVYFDVSDGLKISVPMGMFLDEWATPNYLEVSFQGDVIFNNGKFQITNPKIKNVLCGDDPFGS